MTKVKNQAVKELERTKRLKQERRLIENDLRYSKLDEEIDTSEHYD